ncbi:MAG: hypothetical protein JEZ07_16765 [Phycisphaerae bacterium]|nr:hypothetical protein [Phycisphaerae bacterium]
MEKKKLPFKHKLPDYAQSLAIMLMLGGLVSREGFNITGLTNIFVGIIEISAVLILLTAKVCKWSVTHRHNFHWKKPIFDVFLLTSLITVLIKQAFIPHSYFNFWKIMHVYMAIQAIIHIARFSLSAAAATAPTHILLGSFAGIIILGAFMLMLPRASTAGQQLSFTDAMFTATSATCVTGLVVVDTGSDFTTMGQSVILILIQIGGLGIMIFGAMFSLLLGSRLTLRESIAVSDIINEQSPGRIGRIAVFIFLSTLIFEAIGAFSLFGMWDSNQTFKSIFHSISAFCNAGFALQADSLIQYRSAWQVFSIICPLIIIGGLGFPVLYNFWQIIAQKFNKLKNPDKYYSKIRLSLHSKIVIITTIVLLMVGWIFMFTLEIIRPDGDGNENKSVATIALDSLFNSITARTAGFNTVDIEQLSPPAKLTLIFLMSIGGSPSSTAGGLKTVTLAVMVLAVYATMRHRSEVHAFKRAIPNTVVLRTATLILLYAMILFMAILALLITEHNHCHDLLDLMFEAASALGTVGLSTGITSSLSIAGKWIIIITMFVGRLGPLSLLAALTFNVDPPTYQYPREPLVVG